MAFAVLATVFTSCVNNKETATTFRTAETDEAVNVKVKKVEARDVAQLVEFTANVEANKVNSIAPQAPVRIREIKVEVGQQVTAGQALVIMDNTNLNQVKLQLDNNRLEFQRIDELRKLRKHHPELWEKLLELDRRALAQFGTGPLGQFKQNWSVKRLDTRFAEEDGQTG